jgi:hypothetical protein
VAFILERQKERYRQYLEHLQKLVGSPPFLTDIEVSDRYDDEDRDDFMQIIENWEEGDGDLVISFLWRNGDARLKFVIDLEDGLATFGLFAGLKSEKSYRYRADCEEVLADNEIVAAAMMYNRLRGA